jgi:hypothetical protein
MSESKNEGNKESGGLPDYLKRLAGFTSPAKASKPLKVSTAHVEREDSLPEIVSSPTDVGIFEVGHQGEKLTWKKFFESGRSSNSDQQQQGK